MVYDQIQESDFITPPKGGHEVQSGAPQKPTNKDEETDEQKSGESDFISPGTKRQVGYDQTQESDFISPGKKHQVGYDQIQESDFITPPRGGHEVQSGAPQKPTNKEEEKKVFCGIRKLWLPASYGHCVITELNCFLVHEESCYSGSQYDPVNTISSNANSIKKDDNGAEQETDPENDSGTETEAIERVVNRAPSDKDIMKVEAAVGILDAVSPNANPGKEDGTNDESETDPEKDAEKGK